MNTKENSQAQRRQKASNSNERGNKRKRSGHKQDIFDYNSQSSTIDCLNEELENSNASITNPYGLYSNEDNSCELEQKINNKIGEKNMSNSECPKNQAKQIEGNSLNNLANPFESNHLQSGVDFENIQNNLLSTFMSKNPATVLGNIRHSNKERHRRERIKNSCTIMRHLLPNATQQSTKLDMATVLELIVQYLSYIQRSIPHYIINAINESFSATLIRMRHEQARIMPNYYAQQHNVITNNQIITQNSTSNKRSSLEGVDYQQQIPHHVQFYTHQPFMQVGPHGEAYKPDAGSFLTNIQINQADTGLNNQRQK